MERPILIFDLVERQTMRAQNPPFFSCVLPFPLKNRLLSSLVTHKSPDDFPASTLKPFVARARPPRDENAISA